MNNLARMTCKVLCITDHAVIKTSANGNQHITVLHRHIGFISAVHAEHTQELRTCARETTQAHQGIGNWITE